MTQTIEHTQLFTLYGTVRTISRKGNGMETLELDTPSDMVSIPESMPPLEGMSTNSQDWE